MTACRPLEVLELQAKIEDLKAQLRRERTKKMSYEFAQDWAKGLYRENRKLLAKVKRLEKQ